MAQTRVNDGGIAADLVFDTLRDSDVGLWASRRPPVR
jgi:hypothetical protein